MSESTKDRDHVVPDGNLFLIEVPHHDGPNYLICQKIVTVDPSQSAMGIPWSELAKLFEYDSLRAVPMPGAAEPSRYKQVSSNFASEDPPGSAGLSVNFIFKR